MLHVRYSERPIFPNTKNSMHELHVIFSCEPRMWR